MIEILLNEIFTMDLEQNEKIIQQYIEQQRNKTWLTKFCLCPGKNNLDLFKIVDFGQ